jgi:hypothetical protein
MSREGCSCWCQARPGHLHDHPSSLGCMQFIDGVQDQPAGVHCHAFEQITSRQYIGCNLKDTPPSARQPRITSDYRPRLPFRARELDGMGSRTIAHGTLHPVTAPRRSNCSHVEAQRPGSPLPPSALVCSLRHTSQLSRHTPCRRPDETTNLVVLALER